MLYSVPEERKRNENNMKLFVKHYIYLHIRHFMPHPWSHDMSWWAMRAQDGRAFMRARVRHAYMRVDTGRAGSL